MDKDIREFLDRAEQKRLYEEKRKRKEKRLANQVKRQKSKTRKNTALNGAELRFGERVKGNNELRQLADNGRDYSKGTKFKAKHRTPEAQKKYDWEHRPRFISVPMGGQNKKH